MTIALVLMFVVSNTIVEARKYRSPELSSKTHLHPSIQAAVALAAPRNAGGIPGGLGPEQEVDDELRQVVRKAHSMLQEKFGAGVERLEPLSYRSQVVAGMNYFVKVS